MRASYSGTDDQPGGSGLSGSVYEVRYEQAVGERGGVPVKLYSMRQIPALSCPNNNLAPVCRGANLMTWECPHNNLAACACCGMVMWWGSLSACRGLALIGQHQCHGIGHECWTFFWRIGLRPAKRPVN